MNETMSVFILRENLINYEYGVLAYFCSWILKWSNIWIDLFFIGHIHQIHMHSTSAWFLLFLIKQIILVFSPHFCGSIREKMLFIECKIFVSCWADYVYYVIVPNRLAFIGLNILLHLNNFVENISS